MEKIWEEKMRLHEEKMRLELHVAYIDDADKMKSDTIRLKMKKLKKYVFDKETSLQISYGIIVILVAIAIANLGSCRCMLINFDILRCVCKLGCI
jgi:hypothetical protein